MYATMKRLRDALRPSDSDDMWIGPAPSRQRLEERLRGDDEALNLLFEWSMAEYAEYYQRDERLQTALLGQGVIGIEYWTGRTPDSSVMRGGLEAVFG